MRPPRGFRAAAAASHASILGLLVLSTGLVPAPLGSQAWAYVRTRTAHSGVAIQWVESCVVLSADLRGSRDITIDVIDATLARATGHWAEPTADCSYLRLSTTSPTRSLDVANDGRPVVVFRDQQWRRPGGSPHDPSAIGLTTVFYVDSPGRPGDGTILDADVELNGVNFTFSTTPQAGGARPGTTVADLENTLTHELGHVLGLAHNCWEPSVEATPPVDETGAPIPACDEPLPPRITDATMYPYASTAGETGKRALSADEVAAVCAGYPAQAPIPACFGQVEGGCAAVPQASGAGSGLALGGLAGLLAAIATRARRR